MAPPSNDQRTSPARKTVTIADAPGRVVQAIDAARTDTDYVYDAFGNLLQHHGYR